MFTSLIAAPATPTPIGTNELGWIVIAIILLQVVVGILAVREALSRRRMAQHRAE